MAMKLKSGLFAPSTITCKTCPLAADCQFDQPRRGGFKGQGPKYVGFRIITDAIEQNNGKEDFMRCTDFVSTMQPRMNWGRIRREEGGDGDTITIIAQEGEEIERNTSVAVNSLGEIVRPQAEIIEDLKRAGYTISSDLSPSVGRKDVTYITKVPRFADDSKRIGNYSQKLIARHKAADGAETEAEDRAWAEVKKKARAKEEQQAKSA